MRRSSPGGESTRSAILEAAERLFAEKGFDRGRLEDVAEAVGIRRASIVYYFRDKRELYDAVLDGVFSDFRGRLDDTLSAPGPFRERVDAAIVEWVDYVGKRPTFARIILREVADTGTDAPPAAMPHILPFMPIVQRFLERQAADADLQTVRIAPVHLASAIAGATVFFVAAIPSLVPDVGFDPVSPDHLETHRAEVLKIAHHLMGLSDEAATTEDT